MSTEQLWKLKLYAGNAVVFTKEANRSHLEEDTEIIKRLIRENGFHEVFHEDGNAIVINVRNITHWEITQVGRSTIGFTNINRNIETRTQPKS